jgi:signal transduction histidine kinase
VRSMRWITAIAARPGVPRRTLRLRLTALYGALFLASGAGLLATTYVLVSQVTSNPLVYTSKDGRQVGVFDGGHATGKAGQPQVNQSQGGPSLTPAQLQAQAEQLRTQALDQHAAEMDSLLLNSGIALAVMSVVSIVLGWVIAGRVLRPIRTITRAVHEITATNLHRRLALDGPHDELKDLGDTFDALLCRLESSFQAQRQFVANASHELRTPLARQRTIGQVAISDPDATIQSLRAAHERVLAAGSQQERLIESLLALARGQAGIDRHEPLDLSTVADRVIAAHRAEALRRGLDLHVHLAPAPADGDPHLVERLVTNLVDNALRHNVAQGRLDVSTHTSAGHAVLVVTNTGPHVPADAIDRVFQPFRRLEADRTNQGDGLGIGLSIVLAIAEAHDATLVTRPRPEGGLRIEVTFPHPVVRAEHSGTITRDKKPKAAAGFAITR